MTNEDLDDRLEQLTKALEQLSERLERVARLRRRPTDHVVDQRPQRGGELVGLAPEDEVVAGDVDARGRQGRGDEPAAWRPVGPWVLGGDQHPGRYGRVEPAKRRAS